MLSVAVPVIGPPAVGKTTLTRRLGQEPNRGVFRLREQVPRDVLTATASRAGRLGWIDDSIVARSLRDYFGTVLREGDVQAVLLDNFPGSASQVALFMAVVHRLAPSCVVRAVELVADPHVLVQRAASRRVCQHCERDAAGDPRVPADESASRPSRCARCDQILDARTGDSPRVLAERIRRYHVLAAGTKAAFMRAGVGVILLDSHRSPQLMAADLEPSLAEGRSRCPRY